MSFSFGSDANVDAPAGALIPAKRSGGAPASTAATAADIHSAAAEPAAAKVDIFGQSSGASGNNYTRPSGQNTGVSAKAEPSPPLARAGHHAAPDLSRLLPSTAELPHRPPLLPRPRSGVHTGRPIVDHLWLSGCSATRVDGATSATRSPSLAVEWPLACFCSNVVIPLGCMLHPANGSSIVFG